MKDEERAEEYVNTHCCYRRQDFIRTYLDGLAEGRKEKCNLEQGKDGMIKLCELAIENEQLKVQIEKMKCCANCKYCDCKTKKERKICGKCTLDKLLWSQWELAE